MLKLQRSFFLVSLTIFLFACSDHVKSVQYYSEHLAEAQSVVKACEQRITISPSDTSDLEKKKSDAVFVDGSDCFNARDADNQDFKKSVSQHKSGL